MQQKSIVLKNSSGIEEIDQIRRNIKIHPTEDVLRIIDEVGPDACGALLDPANTVGVMDDPMRALHMLGEHIL